MLTVQHEPYGQLEDGSRVDQYLLQNAAGIRVRLINWGATVTTVEVPDKDGNLANVNMAFESLPEYVANPPYFGGTCGRFANRIAKGKFSLDGNEYTLATNNGPNHLHGGLVGFNKKLWLATPNQSDDEASVTFTYVSPDGEEGYPGELSVMVEYALTKDNELKINYSAQTSAPTVLNLTNHCYWNLAGAKSGATVHDHELKLFCSQFIPVDETGIPTGELAPVAGTCMDFTTPQKIGARITEPVNGNGGYDHCYVVDGDAGTLRPAAKVTDPTTGRVMEIFTTEPGVQLYTANHFDGTADSAGAPKHGAFCLETQHFPDSPNQPQFPTTVLKPGDTYTQTTVHKFSVAK